MKREELITIKQAATLLGCPVSFIKSEINRSRLFPKRYWPRKKLRKKDIIDYRRQTEGSIVWEQFAEAGYVGQIDLT